MPEKIIVIYDKERELKYDFNALCDFEKVSGVSFNGIDVGRLGLFEIRVLLWAGLKHEDEKITIEKAGKILQTILSREIDRKTLKEVGENIADAITASGIFKDNKAEDDEKN